MFLLSFLCVSLAGCGSLSHAPDPIDSESPPSNAVPISVDLGHEVVVQAIGVLGVRYAPGGATPDSGFDCSGLVAFAYFRAAQQALPRTTFDLSRAGVRIDSRDLQPGDLVFFNTQRRPYSHVGIYIGERRFIHAPSSGGTVRIEDMRRKYWLQRFDGARRMAL